MLNKNDVKRNKHKAYY